MQCCVQSDVCTTHSKKTIGSSSRRHFHKFIITFNVSHNSKHKEKLKEKINSNVKHTLTESPAKIYQKQFKKKT